jgi:pimeloyl-ACP methyl ester carboxylesterase
VSTPRTLRVSQLVTRTTIETSRGGFAALVAAPTRGADDHQPALLVPGYTGSKEDFLSVLESLADAGRAVVAIDMRGQYESGPAPDISGYSLSELAEDLIAVAASLGGRIRAIGDAGPPGPGPSHRERVHLVGHSFGGIVSREAAIAAPSALESLTLLGSGPGTIGGERAEALRDLLDFLEPADGDPHALAALIGQLWDARLLPQAQAEGTPPDIIEFLRERTLRTCPVGLAEMARHLLDCPDRTSDLAAAAQWPVLVSYGEHDDAWPPDVQDAMAKQLGADRICLPGAAHSPAVEAPETTSAMLTAFWNQAESGR